MSKYNWKSIQNFYEQGNTWREVGEEFGISMAALNNAKKRGDFVSRSTSEAQRLSQKKKPRVHSEETKKKLSKIRTEYLKKNPDKVPYLLNHHSKGMSYPEKYFEKLFRNENIDLVYHFQIGLYQLDFSDPVRKINIEIDGEQHYDDKRIFLSDRRRDNFLESLGWVVYRIRWSDYTKMTREMKERVVGQIKGVVETRTLSKKEMTKLNQELEELRKPNKCLCGKVIQKRSSRCSSCAQKERRGRGRKVDRPSKEDLRNMINTMTWTAIGKQYGVSDNCIKKWAKDYEIEFKIRPYNKKQ